MTDNGAGTPEALTPAAEPAAAEAVAGHLDVTSTDLRSIPAVLPVPRWFAPLAIFCATGLIPWIVYLALELPQHRRSEHYNVAWVGFDFAMFVALSAMAVAAVKRSTWTEPLATVSATLLLVDAWFDIVTAPTRKELMLAVVLAVVVELPLAILCAWVAHNTERLRRRAFRSLVHWVSSADEQNQIGGAQRRSPAG